MTHTNIKINKKYPQTHRLTTDTKPKSGAFYGIQLENGLGLFYSSRHPHQLMQQLPAKRIFGIV